MKTKVIVVLFMIFISFFAKAETTYRRDHDVCKFNNQTVDIDVRSHEQYAVSEDDEYGQIVFLKNKNKVIRIDLRDMGIGRYRMLKLYNDLCPKILTIPSKDNELAFFFMRDNRPSADLMIVLFYNVESHEYELVEAKLPVKGAVLKNKTPYFKVAKKETEIEVGSTMINNQKYTFIKKPLEPWFLSMANTLNLISIGPMKNLNIRNF